MSSPCLSRALAVAALLALGTAPARADLRVCADPNNLPFSNERGEGFDNRIAELLARELGERLAYTWWPERRSFYRNTLQAGRCDVVMGVPVGLDRAATTRPYYRSSYVFVVPHGAAMPFSLDDEALRHRRIGVQLVGDDLANSPPVHALSRRGIVDNLHGYPVYGDYADGVPGAAIVAAVASGEIDLAIVWGPLAGYLATREARPLDIAPVRPLVDLPMMPMLFDLAVGVRHGDRALKAAIDTALDHQRPAIDAILAGYGVPRLPLVVPIAASGAGP